MKAGRLEFQRALGPVPVLGAPTRQCMPSGGRHDEIGGVHVEDGDRPPMRGPQVVPVAVEDAVGGELERARPQPIALLRDVEVVAEMQLSEFFDVAGVGEAFGGELAQRLEETVTGAVGAPRSATTIDLSTRLASTSNASPGSSGGVPPIVNRPIWLPLNSANQMAPSGPVMMP